MKILFSFLKIATFVTTVFFAGHYFGAHSATVMDIYDTTQVRTPNDPICLRQDQKISDKEVVITRCFRITETSMASNAKK